MDFQLTSEQRMIQELARRMVERDIQPVLDKQDREKPLPKEVMRQLLQVCAGQGLTSARVPQAVGGAGLPTLTYGLMFEQLPPVVGFAIVGQEATATRIAYDSSDEQRERLLPDIIAARKITCTGIDRARRGLRSSRHQDQGGHERRACRHQRPQDVDHQRQHLRRHQHHGDAGQGERRRQPHDPGRGRPRGVAVRDLQDAVSRFRAGSSGRGAVRQLPGAQAQHPGPGGRRGARADAHMARQPAAVRADGRQHGAARARCGGQVCRRPQPVRTIDRAATSWCRSCWPTSRRRSRPAG